MAENVMHTRIVHTHDVEQNWEKASTFIPRLGELICYDPDTKHTSSRFKVGDGIHSIGELPFAVEVSIEDYFSESDGVIYLDGGNIRTYEKIKETT